MTTRFRPIAAYPTGDKPVEPTGPRADDLYDAADKFREGLNEELRASRQRGDSETANHATKTNETGGRKPKWDHVVAWVDGYKRLHRKATDDEALKEYKRRFKQKPRPTAGQLRKARSYRNNENSA